MCGNRKHDVWRYYFHTSFLALFMRHSVKAIMTGVFTNKKRKKRCLITQMTAQHNPS